MNAKNFAQFIMFIIKKKQQNLCCVIISNVIHWKFKKVYKLQSCALRNFSN